MVSVGDESGEGHRSEGPGVALLNVDLGDDEGVADLPAVNNRPSCMVVSTMAVVSMMRTETSEMSMSR